MSSKPRVTERLREEGSHMVGRGTTTAQKSKFSVACPTGHEEAKIIPGRSWESPLTC